MAELIVPVLTAYLLELKAGINDLGQTDGETHRDVAMRLCELSREIRFELGPPAEAPSELVNELVRLFDDTATAIRVSDDKVMAAYAENIRKRAKSIREATSL